MSSQVYYDGDFWAATQATAVTESPAAAPAKWRRLTIPATFEQYLVAAAVAALMPSIGQQDKMVGMMQVAENQFQDAIVADARTNGRGHQPVVFTR